MRFLPALYFAALVFLLLSPAMRYNRILAPIDLYYETPVFAAQRPDNYVEPANPHLFDQAYQFVPWRYHAWSRLRTGDVPLWNPDSAIGTPLVATMQAAVFYPINVVTLALPFETTFAFSALLRLWIAGFFTYLLLRRYRAGRAAGLVAGTSFMLSGFVVGWLGHPHTNVAVWLPALILSVEGLLTSQNRSSATRWWALLAVVTGVQFLGGHIETSRDILLAAGAYAVVRSLQRGEDPVWKRLRRLAAAGAGVAAGALLAAIQLLPFLEWLPLSAEYQARSGFSFDLLSFDSRQLAALPLAVMPNLYGNPTWPGEYWSFNPWSSYNEATLYAGVVALGLAIAALTRWRGDPFARAWIYVGGLALGTALQLPVFDWLNQLPGMALGHPGRLRLIAIFAIAVLAGLGLDALTSAAHAARSRVWLRRALVVVAALVVGVAVPFNLIFPLMANWETRAISRYIDTFDDPDDPPRSVAICRERIEACGAELSDAFRLTNIEMYWPLLVALAGLGLLWLVARRHGVRRWLAPAVVALVAVEMLATSWGYNPAVDSSLLEARVSVLQVSEARGAAGGRTTALQTDMLPDAHLLFGLRDVRGLDFKTTRYERYIDASGDRLPWFAHGVLLDDAGPLITALGVRTIITANPYIVERELAEGRMTEVGTYGGLTLLEPVDPVGRARLVFDAQLASSDEQAAEFLRADPEAVTTRAILADTPEARAAAEALGAPDPQARATSSGLAAERLRWMVFTDEPALLLVSELHYPGWRATVDGEPVELLRANIALRAVLVPPGDHVVEMRYEPTSFRYGALLSLGALAIILAVLAASWLPPLRDRE